jgi:hypothetical protein
VILPHVCMQLGAHIRMYVVGCLHTFVLYLTYLCTLNLGFCTWYRYCWTYITSQYYDNTELLHFPLIYTHTHKCTHVCPRETLALLGAWEGSLWTKAFPVKISLPNLQPNLSHNCGCFTWTQSDIYWWFRSTWSSSNVLWLWSDFEFWQWLV